MSQPSSTSHPVQLIPGLEIPCEQGPPVLLLPERKGTFSETIEPVASQSKLVRFRELRNRVAARGLGLLPARFGARIANGIGILLFHRVVAPPPGVDPPTWNVTPERFRAHLEGLLALGYQAWPLQRVLAYHRAGRKIPPRTFAVTFDDGYENVYSNAFPVLRELGIPATVFLATAYLDSSSPFPFDDWSAKGSRHVPCETWRPLRTAQCEEMLASGLIELGTHSHIHADFRGRPDELRRDLCISLDVLSTRFGVTEAAFAAPFGFGCRKYDGPELFEAAEQAGVTCALTTDSELVRPGDDPFNWGRFAAWETDSARSLAAKLNGWYSLARNAWRWLRRGRVYRDRRTCDMEFVSPSIR